MPHDVHHLSEFVLSYWIQDAPDLLNSLQDFIICYSVNPADVFHPRSNPHFKCWQPFSISVCHCPCLRLHHKEQCSTLYTLLFFSSTLCPVSSCVLFIKTCFAMAILLRSAHISLTVTITWNNISQVLELCDLFRPLSFDKYLYLTIPLRQHNSRINKTFKRTPRETESALMSAQL